ncbi:MAG: hypothetical protein OSB09_01620 [Planctomycetota bacterium]|nr:hypothetical protein [Planctomycetota bacterium]
MTSVTGNLQMTSIRSGESQSAGFTMVELLVTISLIVFLMSMLAVGAGKYLETASVARTEALIARVSLLIDSYHSKVGAFPTDGLDGNDLITTDGSFLTGGAALTYTLTQPLILTRTMSNGEIRIVGDEPPMGDFRSDELSPPSDGDTEARQLLDAWAEPIHYDDVSAGEKSYSPQSDGESHLDWDDEESVHSEDPRDVGEATIGTGPQNIKQFDIWSHGSSGHTTDELYDDLISNWEKD